MTGRKRVFTCLFVMLLGCIFISTPSLAERDSSVLQQEPQPTQRAPDVTSTEEIIPTQNETDPADLPLIEKVAQTYGVSSENLKVEYKEQIELPLTGQSFTNTKVIDVSTGVGYSIASDASGSIVDAEALRVAEKNVYYATYGKLHPSLASYLLSLSSDDMVQVSIWLDMGNQDASMPRPQLEQAASMSAEEIDHLRAQYQAQAALIHQEVEQPLLDILPSLGGELIEASDTAPLVFVEIPVSSIPQLESLPYVVTIDLLVEGGPEQDGGGEEKTAGGLEMNTARPASKANIVEARGITGTGVWTAVVEGDSINFANPYIPDGACGPTGSCPNIQEHPSAVGGIIASSHSTYRGTAPGIGTHLLSANGGGYDLASIQSATSWADGMGTDVYNNSYFIESDGVMHNSDRYLDYIVRAAADLEVKSAGNRGLEADKYVTSPGLGYNTLTVASADDNNTLAWSDDTISAYSSYVAPPNRQKPDLTAIGCNTNGAGLGITITGMYTPWIYDQGCGTSYAAPIVSGGGALLIQRVANLYGWPETEKAILLASALHNIEGATRYSQKDGAGAVDLAAADTIAANGWFGGYQLYPSSFDASYYFTAKTIYLYAGERMRAALAYDSNPSGDYTSDPLEGDLDLYLRDPFSSIVAGSASVDSWELIDYTPSVSGNFTILVENHGGSLSGSEWTYAGVAVWPGHYVLAPYVSQTRNTPPGAWNQDSGDDYRFTRNSYWNAVGIREAPSDYDVFLFNNSVYGDPANHMKLEDSTLSGSTVDFVVVDGNHAPSGDYYATVSAFSGTDNYSIQQATHTIDVGVGTFGPYPMVPSDVLRVWDTSLENGIQKYFAIRPVSGDANLGMALYLSNSGNSASWYQGRNQSVSFADSNGSGGRETMNYLPSASDWMGLVVWNNSSTTGTNYYLYADTSSPNGTITINGGVDYTNSTNVTLTLDGVDAQTGVYQMRFSNNGTTWSVWEPYAASKAWTITSGDGTKTVYVQYMNNAEMASGSISTTIILDTVKPTGTIVVNGGVAYTNSANVSLTLSAIDDLSGVAQMRFGNYGEPWGAWEPYTTSKAWVLASGDGQKSVWVEYRDNAGNISNQYADYITLDTIAPTSFASSPTQSLSLDFIVTWTGSDALSGVAYYDVQYRVGTGGTWTDWLTNTSASSALFGTTSPVVVAHLQTYYFRVRAYDVSGNVEDYPGGDGDSSTFILDVNYIPIISKP